ncbi:hypothetical protein RND81_08G125200 [Saponaria officinalis]|uniref:Pectinesterase inhibitor domain-containing protein n=1 Tax=Saponaria officinalis TaxID=3572 RepID=A0AAW1J6J9_SAPOF
MTKSPFSTILTLLLITLTTTTSTTTTTTTNHPNKPSKQFIKTSCHVTQYPKLCYHTLSPFATKINRSDRQLVLTALALSLGRARSAAQYVAQTQKFKGMKHREFEAVKDCIDTMGDSVDQLTRSFIELGHMGRVNDGEDFMWHISNVQTWVSAALTDANTCMDGFSGRVMSGEIKGGINMRLTNVAQLTSNALALVNNFANRH